MLRVDWTRHTSLKISGDICYGASDIEVAETFEAEAAEVRKRLSVERYDAVFTSPLSRASKLCEACGFGADAVVEPRVAERNFGDFEHLRWEEIDELARKSPALLDEAGHLLPPNGESVDELLARVADFITGLRCSGYRRVLVFCHGGVINSARSLQGLLSREQLFIDVPLYGSTTSLEYAALDERAVKNC